MTSDKWRSILQAFGILGLILCLFLYRSLLLGEIFSPAGILADFHPWKALFEPGRLNSQRNDDVFLFFPMFATHFKLVLQGIWPWWDPTKLGGTMAFWGGVNLGQLLYPFSLVFLLPLGKGLALYAFLRLFVAGTGMYLYLKTMHVSHGSSLLGAIAFMLNGVFVVWLSSALPTIWAWLPWALLATEWILRRSRRNAVAMLSVVVLSLAFGFQFLGAYVALSFVFMVVWGLYTLVRLLQEGFGDGWSFREWLGRFGWLSMGLIGGVAVGALGIFPMLAALTGSSLAARTSGTAAYPLYNGITFLIPNFFGNPSHGNWAAPVGNYCEFVSYLGILPLFLALLAIFLAPRNRLVPLFAGLALFCLLYMYGLPGLNQIGLLPGFRQTLTSRWTAPLATAVAVLAAIGMDALLAQKKRRQGPWLAFCLVTSVLVLAAMGGAWHELVARGRVLYQLNQVGIFAANLLLISLVLTLWNKNLVSESGAKTLAVLLLVLDLGMMGIGFNPTLPQEHFYPETPGLRFLEREAKGYRVLPYEQTLFGDIPGIFGLEALTGYDVSGDLTYRRYLYEAGDRSFSPDRALTANDYLEATAAPGSAKVNELKLNVDPRSPLVGRLGTAFFIAPPNGSIGVQSLASQHGHDGIVEPLTKGRKVVQTFKTTAQFNHLSLLVGTYARRNHGFLSIELASLAGSPSCRLELDERDFDDNQWNSFELPSMPPGSYRLTISSKSDAANAVTLYRASQNAYPDGDLQIDGRPGGDLCFVIGLTTSYGLPVAYQGKDLKVYANPAFHERVWFAGRARAVKSDDEAYEILRSASSSYPTDVLLASPPAGSTERSGSGSVSIIEWRSDRIRLLSKSDGPGFIMLSERFDPHWKAQLDGRPVPILRGDVLLRAVQVKAGKHELVYTYDDPLRIGSFALSLSSILGFLLLGLVQIVSIGKGGRRRWRLRNGR